MKNKEIYQTPIFAKQADLILNSYFHWFQKPLIQKTQTRFQEIFQASFVLLSHDIQTDPILNFANHQALKLWEMDWKTFIHTPSRLTAEAPNREERQKFLSTVQEKGFIENYSGIRISSSGRRFRIEQAKVWNLIDENSNYAGQAALFDQWQFLE
ncbi:MAG: MEKHLA domain-containing protein [Deltaproteobacteria bacterium]|nr:MEKHLA domain-containing protein [Deltaproteobacteria bacterium]